MYATGGAVRVDSSHFGHDSNSYTSLAQSKLLLSNVSNALVSSSTFANVGYEAPMGIGAFDSSVSVIGSTFSSSASGVYAVNSSVSLEHSTITNNQWGEVDKT